MQALAHGKRSNGSRLITFIGEHEGNLMFNCPSFTTRDTIYEIVLYRDEGKATCDCMDASCRKKFWSLYDPNPKMCKHLRSLREHVLPFLQKAGFL